MKTTRKSMPRPSWLSLRRPTSPTSSPVAVRGILDSYRSAQQQQTPPPSTSPSSAPELDDDDDGDEGGEACPVGCVTQIFGRSELEAALAAAEARGGASASSSFSSSSSLPPGIVVVDFYKKACGACK